MRVILAQATTVEKEKNLCFVVAAKKKGEK